MTRILILQEKPGRSKALQKSLHSQHDLIFVDSPGAALQALKAGSVDLIICRIHLDRSSAFDFLIDIKKNPSLSTIPFICFSGELNERARSLDDVLSKSAHLCGADKYISLARYWREHTCDFDALRRDIEGVLAQTRAPSQSLDPPWAENPSTTA